MSNEEGCYMGAMLGMFKKVYLAGSSNLLCLVYSLAGFFTRYFYVEEKKMVELKNIKEVAFIIGIAAISGYYGLTCFTFILTYLTGHTSVTIHMNLYGELVLEFIVTLISLPFAVYTIKETIRLKKAELKLKKLVPTTE